MAETKKVEVVISGIAGVFPESNSVDELKTLLFNKQNGITLDSRRWPLDKFGLSSGVGKLKCINKFDNVFFNMHGKLCECSENVMKLILERSVEAIIDAGINPGDLYNTNTAVFMCSSISETDSIALFDATKSGLCILGHNKSMQANRLSYVLNLNGPSFTILSSLSGSADAIFMAKHMIEKGYIRSAIIGGCNLVLEPNMSLQLKGLGVLNDGIETKSFSEDANGFNRSESCVAILLQNSLDARRSYGTLLNVKTEQYGELRGVFTNYSTEHYKQIVMDAYKEAGVDPATIAYIEADGCAIKNVDAMELDVIKDVFCTPNRKKPLKIGSIKSNLGHSDATSGLVAIVKTIIAMDSGYIPPNINYSTPNSQSNALTSGKLQVVTEKTPLDGDVIGMNIFGRTGNYGHIIFKRHDKQKKKIYKQGEMFDDGLPRLILVSGRSDVGLTQTIKKIESYYIDEEYVSLLHKVFSKNISAHFFRSFFIVPEESNPREKDVFPITKEKPAVWFVFSGMGSQWLGMGTQLLRIPIFAKAIEKCDSVLRPLGVDIVEILTSLKSSLFDNILNSFVGIAAIQIGLVDILRALDIEPDGMIGHSVGELGCAYADGCFTAEEMIMAAYSRGRASVETKLPSGKMAAIGLGNKTIMDRLPADIDVACHNSSESCTISGLTESVEKFVDELKSEGVFAKTVNVSDISFHSRYIQPAAPTLLKYLKKLVPNPKQRSSRWRSTSIPESKWDTDLARYCSAEYHTNNLLSPVLFEEVAVNIPKNAVVIEIAPHGLLQAILKRSLRDAINIPLTQKVFGDSVKYLLTAIGKMYCSGLNPNIEMLYNPVNYPVCAGTSPLYTLCSWNHVEEWPSFKAEVLMMKTRGERKISLSQATDSEVEDYEIYGHQIIPLSALLFYTWKSFIELQDENDIQFPIVFQDINYRQHIVINQIQSSELCTTIQPGTGCFEFCLDNTVILSGYISKLDSLKSNSNLTACTEKDNCKPIVSLNCKEVYASLEKYSYCVGDVFKTIKHIDIFEDQLQSTVSWDNNWIHYLDGILQLPTLYHIEKRGELVVPVLIQELCINPTLIDNSVPKDFLASYNIYTHEVTCTGVKIFFPHFGILSLEPLVKTTFQLWEQGLINLENPDLNTPLDFIDMCMNIALEYRYNEEFKNIFFYSLYDDADHSINNYSKLIMQNKYYKLELVKAENINNGLKNSQYIVLTQDNKLSTVKSLMSNKNNIHLIVSSNGPMSDNNDYTVILQQKFGGKYLSLMKKILKTNSDCIIHRLTTENINHTDEFNKLLTNLDSMDRIIYIVSNIQPSDGILTLVKKIEGIKYIRFYFIFDNSAPAFNINNPFYSKQLAKDLLLNVYKNGEWITYKEIQFITKIKTQTSMKKTLLASLSNTSLKNMSVEYIGLNPLDMSINLETKNNNNVDCELGPIDYSCLTPDGTMVMGVAPFVPTIAENLPDPILSWTIPKNISLEEASTIPVPYCMAYYMLIGISKITEKDLVLVHAGLTAVGRAAIDVCLEAKCQVFVTVSDSKQMELLKQRFPTLPHSNIIIYDSENFEIKCLMANKMMSVVINCLEGNDFHATFRLIGQYGRIFQLTKSDMKKKYKMGLERFLKSISFFSVSMDTIIMENEDMKLLLKKNIEQGLENGTIKPFDRYVLTGVCTGTQALEVLENLTRENEFKRVVIPISKIKDTENISHQFLCNPNKVYFVVANGSDDWLCLVEWLVQRGCLKVVVALDKHYCLTPKISRKFNILMDRYKGITVQLESQSSLYTEEFSSNFLNNLTATYPLAAVFFVNTVEEKIIENMQFAINQIGTKIKHKPMFVCLFCGGEKHCENLKSAGFNTLCVSWGHYYEKPKLEKIIPILDNLLLKSEFLKNPVVICSEFEASKHLILDSTKVQNDYKDMYLPNSINELEDISNYIVSEPDFVEMNTKSVLYVDAKGAFPIFVIPGFRPNTLNNFYKNLGYPTFEARFPEKFESIYNIADVLVKKLRKLTEHSCVTLVGESWGGSVALIMTQILESEGIIVSLSLLNGIPNTCVEWVTKNIIQNNNMNAILLSKYLSIDEKTIIQVSTKQGWNNNLIKLLRTNNISSVDNVCKSINMIKNQLDTLIAFQPLSNKIISKPIVFLSEELFKHTSNVLNEFCINPPIIKTITNLTSRSLLENAEVIKTINENVAYDYPHSSTNSLDDKYNQHYYSNEMQMIC